MRTLLGLTLPDGFNWFLILISVIVTILVILSTIYILIEYQHPEDRNQAWFPKCVVILGLSIAILSVLLFPLDVANAHACNESISPSSCRYTLPMKQLWWAVFIINLVLVWAIIPFTVFFYEADLDFSLFQKIKSALIWTLGFVIFIAAVLGICYGLFGYVQYPTQELVSGTLPLDVLRNLTSIPTACIKPLTYNQTSANVTDYQCNAFGPVFVSDTWKLRTSLPVYVIAIQSVLGWLLFLVFAGVGMLCAPIDWMQQFAGRPKATITKSEYIRRAQVVSQRAKLIMNTATVLKRQDKDRRWRSNLARLNREVVQLEEDEYALERVFPQGEDGEVRWVLYVISFWLIGFSGLVGLGVSLAWIAHIIAYMLPKRPFSPLLNDLFTTLDGVFSLFGVIAFAFFCLYLVAISMKGNFMLGMNFVVIKLYPMRSGATMMSSFLVNTGIILAMVPAIVQFCAQAFAVYADGTNIFDVFGNQVLYLMGIRYIYNTNTFLYLLLAVSFLAAIFMAFQGATKWRRKKPEEAYTLD